MASHRYRALVVDDDVAIHKLIARELAKRGIDSDLASDGQEAAEMIAARRYDAVVTDLKMPRMHGHALALQVLQMDERPCLIALTGVAEPRLAEDLLARGVDDILLKPVDFSFLAVKVKALIARNEAKREAEAALPSSQEVAPTPPVEEAAEAPISLEQLNAQMGELSRILPISNAAIDVYDMTRSPKWSVSQIAAAIQRDASLTAEVLRLANSSLYNRSERRIVDVQQAVLRIGQERVGELSLSASALTAVAPGMLPWMNLEATWRRSMAAGIALELLVDAGDHQSLENGLLLSAIMHPLGRVVLGMMFPKHYEAMAAKSAETGASLQELERQLLPTSHTEFMAAFLASWNVPHDVCLPLKFSSDDFPALARLAEPRRTRAELVKLAVLLGQLAVGRWERWDLVQWPGPGLFKRLGINSPEEILRQIRSDVVKLEGFRPGGFTSPPEEKPASPAVAAMYCNLTGEDADLMPELLASIGLHCETCPADDLRTLKGSALVNCIGVAATRYVGRRNKNKTIVLADFDRLEIFSKFACAVGVPESYARICDDVLKFFARQSEDDGAYAEKECAATS